jgi:hypothetical protein
MLLMLPLHVHAWPSDAEPDNRHGPIVEIRETVGDGVGFENGYFSTGAFIPLFKRGEHGLLFSDLQINALNSDPIAANLGLGYRFYSDDLERIFGIYNYYDFRESHGFNFKQITTGLEILGENHDMRMTAYLPSAFSDQMVSADAFAGNSLLIDRFAVPLHGFDMEVGVRVPLAEQYEPRLFGGSYYLAGDGVSGIWGWKTRIESRVSDALRLDLAVQDDPLNGTTINAGFALRFPTSGLRGLLSWHDAGDRLLGISRRRLEERLTDPVHRRPNIVITEQPGTIARHPDVIGPLADPHPKAGQAIVFQHVGAGNGGNGSESNPHATLEAALADPAYQTGRVDVIYVRQDTAAPVVHSGNITNLVAATSILSDGPVQQIDTQLGFRQLPHSGIDPFLRNLPQIAGRVTLADNTRLSGFDIRQGIAGTTVSGVNILDNRISNSGGDGIRLTQIGSLLSSAADENSVGSFVGVNIERNIFDVTNGSGINLEVTGITDNIIIGKNTITNSGNSGIVIGGKDYGKSAADLGFIANIEIGLTRIVTTNSHGVEFTGTGFTEDGVVQISNSNIEVTGSNNHGIRIDGETFKGSFNIFRTSGLLSNNSIGQIVSTGGDGVHLTTSDFSGQLLLRSNSLIAGDRALFVDGTTFAGGIRADIRAGSPPQVFSGLSDVAIELRNLNGDLDQIQFQNSILSSNSPSGTDFFAEFIGPGTKVVELRSNVSTNPLPANPAGPFNFNLQNSGSGGFVFLPDDGAGGIINTNTGTIGLNGMLIGP